ncbi:MAG: leucyl aminopeptidase [Psychrobacter sp.]|nr:leucyl aminopeptidase [Psychrobacter sp.]
MKLQLTQSLGQAQPKKLLKKAVPQTNATDTLVVLVDEGRALLGAKTLGEQQERIERLIEAANFEGKLATTLTDYGITSDKKSTKQSSQPLLLVGIGKQEKLTQVNLEKIAKTIYQALSQRSLSATLVIGNSLESAALGQLAQSLLAASYRFDKYKSEQKAPMLETISLFADPAHQETIDFVQAVFEGQSLTRDVANEPGNICFPAYLAEQAEALAKQHSDVLKVTVLGEKEMEKLGMHCFLSVSKGSVKEGKLVLLEYQGKSSIKTPTTSSLPLGVASGLKAVADKLPTKRSKKKAAEPNLNHEVDSDAPIVLVGKGVTFDSGGISIKPGAAMDEMKFDMGGAASVLGTIKALCEARLPINVVGALACAENMPSGEATRPGDIVKAMNGMTIEILNTDAEGRLVLADTLCYVKRYNPKVIIDVATLTGACVIALGHVRSAVYANDEDVLFELENASEQSGDLIWHMPLDDAYQPQLDSPIADIQNIGGRAAGSVTAACFLSRFIDDNQAWAHLDIAGTAWSSGKDKAATGRPVPLFMQYLKNAADAQG